MAKIFEEKFDVAVIGAGHAGIESAYIAAKMGAKVILFTLSADFIGQMSCNPSIGGVAKGIVVREIDALGGLMGLAIDYAGIQFKMLNTKKGKAVWAVRAQADKKLYRSFMKKTLEEMENIWIHQDEVIDILTNEKNEVIAVRTRLGLEIPVKSVVVATGTFLNGK